MSSVPMPVERHEFPPEAQGLAAYIQATPTPDGYQFAAAVDACLTAYELEVTLRWFEDRAMRLQEHGPEPDGWSRHEDGSLYRWGRLVEMPPL